MSRAATVNQVIFNLSLILFSISSIMYALTAILGDELWLKKIILGIYIAPTPALPGGSRR
jgi:hypothetical protein